MLSILTPIVLAALVGALVLRAFVRIPSGVTGLCIVLGFGFPLGAGLFTLVLFAGSTFWGLRDSGPYLAAALAGAVAILAREVARRSGIVPADIREELGHPTRRVIAAIAMVAATAAVLLCVSCYEAHPHGMWDAQAMWNARARVMFRAPEQWLDVFSDHHPHPDYPLMLSSLVFTAWSSFGRETQIAPLAIAIAFATAGAAALAGSLRLLKGRNVALLGLALLVSNAGYVTTAASQYADIPLAATVCAAGGFVLLAYASSERRTQLLVLAGVTAALGGWVKNEGWLLTVALPVGVIAAGVRTPRRAASDALALAAGALPVVAVLLYFKSMTPANDITAAAHGAGLWDRLSDPGRWQQIVAYYSRQFWAVQGKSVPVLGIAAGVLLIAGVRVEERLRQGLVAVAVTGALMMLGHIGSFVVSPHDLNWHLVTAGSRLAMQVTPLVLLLMLCCVRTDVFRPNVT